MIAAAQKDERCKVPDQMRIPCTCSEWLRGSDIFIQLYPAEGLLIDEFYQFSDSF